MGKPKLAEFLRAFECHSSVSSLQSKKSERPFFLKKTLILDSSPLFQLLNGPELNLDRVKTKEFFWILNECNPIPLPTGQRNGKKKLLTQN